MSTKTINRRAWFADHHKLDTIPTYRPPLAPTETFFYGLFLRLCGQTPRMETATVYRLAAARCIEAGEPVPSLRSAHRWRSRFERELSFKATVHAYVHREWTPAGKATE